MAHSVPAGESIRPIIAAIRSLPISHKPSRDEPSAPYLPFITISCEPGAGAWTLAKQLAEALNAADPGPRPWTCWDRELVEKVAAEHRLPSRLVQELEEARHTWLGDLLGSLSFSDSAPASDEATIYARVAETIRALAKAGRVIIVGRGGVFLTRRMPGGIHVRLVAPLEYRVCLIAKQLNISHEAAAAHLRELDRNCRAFYERHWPGESLKPEAFTITLNTASISMPAMIEILKILVRQPVLAADAKP